MPSWKVNRVASITNQPAWTVGGLGPTVGKGPFASKAIQINANGQGPFRFRTFCTNQLGNIGGGLRNSMFSSSSDGTNGCRDQVCVKAPYCASGELASSQHTLTVGCSAPFVPCSAFGVLGFGTTDYQPTAFGSLSNPIFSGLPIIAVIFSAANGGTPAEYGIFFPTASVNQLQNMNISIEVSNNQGSASTTTTVISNNGLLAAFSNSLNSTFINIVNTVGSTYTLKINQTP